MPERQTKTPRPFCTVGASSISTAGAEQSALVRERSANLSNRLRHLDALSGRENRVDLRFLARSNRSKLVVDRYDAKHARCGIRCCELIREVRASNQRIVLRPEACALCHKSRCLAV